jgi:hypothetical protein
VTRLGDLLAGTATNPAAVQLSTIIRDKVLGTHRLLRVLNRRGRVASALAGSTPSMLQPSRHRSGAGRPSPAGAMPGEFFDRGSHPEETQPLSQATKQGRPSGGLRSKCRP